MVDSLPDEDSALDPVRLDVFRPLAQLEPYNLDDLLQRTVQSNVPDTTDLYCAVCKKKFNNESTWQSHTKSAKHITNAKKQQATSVTRVTRSRNDPQVADALQKLELAKKASNPSTAVPALWNLAKFFFNARRPKPTFEALASLVDCLENIPGTLPNLSSSQISSTLYLARLAMARLLCLYRSLDLAHSYCLDALHNKWKLNQEQIIQLANQCPRLTVSALLLECEKLASKYLEREKNRTTPAKVITDPNNSITAVLFEVGSIFAQADGDDQIAIVLLCTAATVCCFEPSYSAKKKDYLALIGQLYEKSGQAHLALQTKLLCGDWCELFDALLMALEMDDLVQATRIVSLIHKRDGYNHFADLELLLNITEAIQQLDPIIQSQLLFQIDHIHLLLHESPETKMVLNALTASEQDDMIKRLRKVIS